MNLTVQVLEIALNGAEMARGELSTKALPGLVVHVILGTIFIAALRGAVRENAPDSG